MKQAMVILGNQLFPYSYYQDFKSAPIFMAEDRDLCTHFKYHQHKLMHFLLSMRKFAQGLKEKNFDVLYHELSPKTYFERLKDFVKAQQISTLNIYEVEDHFFAQALEEFARQENIQLVIHSSPMFLVSRQDFKNYLSSVKKPFMKTFYERLRKERKILMDPKGRPLGGKWSFDEDNRKKLPKKIELPEINPLSYQDDQDFKNLQVMIEENFGDHPGDLDQFWIPSTRQHALDWWKEFKHQRFQFFGAYEDAMTPRSPFLFHSVLSPLLNIGLLTPQEIIDDCLELTEKVPLNSLEGLIRQIIGWREFIRGIYQNFDEHQQQQNFFGHTRLLNENWYIPQTNIPILNDVIARVLEYGYCHHIERLMVLSNLMLLCEIHPKEVYRWFMEMFVDSSDWVMGPNVFGMGQFSDGGLFATKPYICGSNYLLKMSDYPKGPWCDIDDGLYWRFIFKHRDFFSKNPRLNMMTKNLDRMDPERKKLIFAAAENFIQEMTNPSE